MTYRTSPNKRSNYLDNIDIKLDIVDFCTIIHFCKTHPNSKEYSHKTLGENLMKYSYFDKTEQQVRCRIYRREVEDLLRIAMRATAIVTSEYISNETPLPNYYTELKLWVNPNKT